MNLLKLSQQLLVRRLIGDGQTAVRSLVTDSRQATPGSLFFCLPGHTVDGHDYAAKAVEVGAAALVTNRELPLSVPQLIVPDTRFALAALADYAFGRPSHILRPIGVTGTNGKRRLRTSLSASWLMRERQSA